MMPCHHQKSSIRNQMIRITLFDHYRTEKSYDIKTWLIKRLKLALTKHAVNLLAQLSQSTTESACANENGCITESKRMHNNK